MKFYIGQPVVCLRDAETWRKDLKLAKTITVPQRGHRYTVRAYCPVAGFSNFLQVGELDTRCNSIIGLMVVWFKEDGFAPITEDQVKGMIDEALRTPIKGKELV